MFPKRRILPIQLQDLLSKLADPHLTQQKLLEVSLFLTLLTFLALQEPDIKDTFVVVKGESSRVAPGSCCSICGERVEIMKEHVTWTLTDAYVIDI